MGSVHKKVPARGDWYNPSQQQNALLSVWNRLTAEEIDLKAFATEPDISYYNRPFKQDVKCEYDIRFHYSLDYDQKKAYHFDRDKSAVIRANIYKEERERVIPLVTSQNYGHRKYNLEGLPVVNHKKLRVMDEVLRRFRINVKPSKKLPIDYEYPKI